MNGPELLAAIEPVVDAFQQLGVEYSLVGSVVSSLHGVARSTLDADVVADLRANHVEALVARTLERSRTSNGGRDISASKICWNGRRAKRRPADRERDPEPYIMIRL